MDSAGGRSAGAVGCVKRTIITPCGCVSHTLQAARSNGLRRRPSRRRHRVRFRERQVRSRHAPHDVARSAKTSGARPRARQMRVVNANFTLVRRCGVCSKLPHAERAGYGKRRAAGAVGCVKRTIITPCGCVSHTLQARFGRRDRRRLPLRDSARTRRLVAAPARRKWATHRNKMA